MNLDRIGRARPGIRVAVLVLAAVVTSGCTAPDSDERAQLGRVSGFVVDESSAPIAGAQVMVVDRVPGAQIGTRNYLASRGPFFTNESGQFIIPDVQVRPSDQIVLNLAVTHPSFLTGYGSRVPTDTIVFGGTRLVGGVRTRDIVVDQEPISDVMAVLPRLGSMAAVGPEGNIIAVPVNEVGGIPLVTPLAVTVDVPAGALESEMSLAVSPLNPRGIVNTTAAMPSQLPVLVGEGAFPQAGIVTNEAGGAEIDTVTPLSALDIRLYRDGVTVTDTFFAAGKAPTVSLPMPFTLPDNTQVPVIRFGDGSSGRSRQGALPGGDVGLGVWTLVGYGLTRMGRTVSFTVDRPGTYAAVVALHWSLGAQSASGQELDYNPLRSYATTGYLATNLDNHLGFNDLNSTDDPQELVFLREALAAVTGQVTEGFFPVFVPPGTSTGVHCTAMQRSVRADLRIGAGGGSIRHEGTWRFWAARLQSLPVLENVPSYLLGHVQGGGIEL